MKPPAFAYQAPSSLAEALALLHEHGGDAKVLAGGQSLIPLLNFRLARPAVLIDINHLEQDLAYIRQEQGQIRIGALTRQAAAERSTLLQEAFPILPAAIRHIGHFQIRNRGTIGGSLVHADPAAELGLVVTLLDAELVIRSHEAERVVAATDFFLTYLTTAIDASELLVEVRLPVLPGGAGCSFQEVARRSGDFALAAAGAVLTPGPGGSIQTARIAVGGVGPVPQRVPEAEALLQGQQPSAELFAEAARRVQRSVEPDGDVHASGAYRRHVVGALVGRTLTEATAQLHTEGERR